MLSISNLSFYFGSRAMYDEASLHIKPKDKIGLIGANGTGKSTLLRIIHGEYQPDGGNISKSNECTIGFLNQDLMSYLSDDSILDVAMQAFERAVQVQKEIDEVLHEMEVNYEDKQVDKLAKLQDEFDRLDGYNMQNKTEEILEGLGFTTEDLPRPLKEFSGGWRMRVMLAKLLLQKPSLLMLDEPTNHMDLPSIQWIENYLSSYEGALIIVSHDRQFLDGAVTSIVEVQNGRLNVYAGNYSFYLEEKELRKEIQKGAFENQQSQIKQAEKFIERFRSKASKASLVQSRVKALERLDIIDDVMDESAKVNFKFNFTNHPGRYVLHLENINKSYPPRTILKGANGVIERGDKIALIGANGKGKSTLLRIIDGGEEIDGERREGHNVVKSFFAQHQLESLNIENTLLEELAAAGSKKTEMELRGILGCFLFSGDDAFKKIKVLSGGEKSRVALAKTLISEANFLLLDEPTNHLDMMSVNILIQALIQYEGTFVAISHDRHFITQIATKIWYIEDEEIKEYPGTY
ncbi:MAG: Zinc import ATP-binding protein ZnuC, partial [Bacteroidota bacterium]